ncbi:hypothetical protein RAS1_32930 [Phycisphaerae bacterium RAS1]|nr:hypothetical protein RAS1_32930 [Phycisphaerae bacterium RAS1]
MTRGLRRRHVLAWLLLGPLLLAGLLAALLARPPRPVQTHLRGGAAAGPESTADEVTGRGGGR